jgi:signal peptidase I
MAACKRFFPNIRSAFSVVIMIAIWLAFAPTQVGGLASYIMVIGNSMEPNFHIGDLVIVHEQPTYQVGDAIVYRNLELKNFVFHRIISQQLGRYTLKGDNNSWMDAYEPSQGEVIGKLWLHVPHGGTAIQKIRSPFVMALIAGALGAVLAARLFGKKTKGNKYMNNQPVHQWFTSIKQRIRNWSTRVNNAEPKKPLHFNQGEILEGSIFALGVIALSSLILGMVAFSRPVSRIVQDDISYQHLGVFSYSASAPQGIYDTNTIKGGDPVFTKSTCSVDVNFQYTLLAAQAENITGTYQLTASISEPTSGWQRLMPLQEETAFAGTAFVTSTRLDLCKISLLTQSMEQGTDFHPGTYTLVITPNVKLAGNLSGRVLESTFNTGLVFRHDRVQFYLVRNEEQGNPLVLSETGVLREANMEANTLLLWGREISIPTLRWMALIGLIASLSGFTLLELRLQNLSRRDQEKYFRIKYNSTMIDVQNEVSFPPSTMIDVTSMEALAKLAERFHAIILHGAEGNRHTYYMQVGGATYRFMISAEITGSTILRDETLHQEGRA